MGVSVLGVYLAVEGLCPGDHTCSAFRDTAHKKGSFYVNKDWLFSRLHLNNAISRQDLDKSDFSSSRIRSTQPI